MPSVRAIKEVLKAVANCTTIKYPFGPPAHLPEGFRGRLQIDHEKCIACGACTMVCASGALSRIEDGENVGVKVQYSRCIFCGQCQDSCPTQAIKLSTDFALTTTDLDSLILKNELPVVKCQICGKPVVSKTQLEWGLKRVLENINPSMKQVVIDDAAKFLNLCIDCRMTNSIRLNIHTRKYV
ncbi:MAG: 4Fe-4S binding protein [Nitrososphaerales archaeon]